MLDLPEINQIATQAAGSVLGRPNLTCVESDVGSDFNDAEILPVTVVISADLKDGLIGDDALNVIYQINRQLSDAGEDRFALIDFSMEDELLAADEE